MSNYSSLEVSRGIHSPPLGGPGRGLLLPPFDVYKETWHGLPRDDHVPPEAGGGYVYSASMMILSASVIETVRSPSDWSRLLFPTHLESTSFSHVRNSPAI